MLPYLSALENAIVFKGALQMSRFTLLYFFTYCESLNTSLSLAVPVLTSAVTYSASRVKNWRTLLEKRFTAQINGQVPDFIQDPTISADCFRRLLKTYLFVRYKCIQHVRCC